MSNQHQYGLLPCKLQGGVNHETTGKRPYLVRINRVLHVVDIHNPDPESPVRSPAEGLDTGKLRQQWLTNPAVSNPEAGAGPPFSGLMLV